MDDHTILRIGNFVRCDAMKGARMLKSSVLPENVFRVNSLTETHIGLDLGTGITQKIEPKYIREVAITPEWLTALGVRFINGRWFVNGFSFTREEGTNWFTVLYDETPSFSGVHKLQNVYRDFANEKLILTKRLAS